MVELYVRLVNWLEERKELLTERREGQGLVEYALIIVLVAIVCVGALGTLQGDISAALNKIGGILNPATPAT